MRRNLKRKSRGNEEEKENTTPKKQRTKDIGSEHVDEVDEVDEAEDDEGSPTPKANGILKTPTKKTIRTKTIGSATRADRSAKRKSANTLFDYDHGGEDGDDDGFGAALAREILEDRDAAGNEETWEGYDSPGGQLRDDLVELAAAAGSEIPQETPSKKRGRGRPKGSKNRRSPTPEGDLPPQERYFFQNRTGPPEVSNHTLASLKLMTHDEYYGLMRDYKDHHDTEIDYLAASHAAAFPQWRFELHEAFNICLYGWGSKRKLVNAFAEWLYPKYMPPPEIIVVNGYMPKLNIRTILNTLLSAAIGDKDNTSHSRRLGSQPSEILTQLLSHLTSHPPPSPLILLINCIDSPPLRRHPTQHLLSRLATHPSIHLLATTDTPHFPLLWDGKTSDRFNFVYHDCTTYAAYGNAEVNVVDDVHELLGRKGRRVGGGEGVAFVLKSLTENSRKLYLLLLTEILTVIADQGGDVGVERGLGHGQYDEDDDDDIDRDGGTTRKRKNRSRRRLATETDIIAGEGEIGIEYRTLYQKASENFVCSSEMNFRTLLKEFYDHQMIVSIKDGGGGTTSSTGGGGGGRDEILGVPLSKDEMETLLLDSV